MTLQKYFSVQTQTFLVFLVFMQIEKGSQIFFDAGINIPRFKKVYDFMIICAFHRKHMYAVTFTNC